MLKYFVRGLVLFVSTSMCMYYSDELLSRCGKDCTQRPLVRVIGVGDRNAIGGNVILIKRSNGIPSAVRI